MSEEFPIEFGRYQLLERLAFGGMAELFRAQSSGAHGFERIVVIKRILPHLAADEHFTKMFIDEAKITARLQHPKIAQTYELGREGQQLFIAMEWIDGLDGLALLRELAYRREKIPQELAVYIVQEVADALDFAHSRVGEDGKSLGIVHRDVSPSNVLMSRNGDVKLVDFGIAQAVQREHKTKAGTLKGKYGYMSPEQVTGNQVDNQSDVFSMGVVLAEMLMGRRLFAAPNELDVLLMVRDVNLSRLKRFGADIPEDLRAVIENALSKDRTERFGSAGELRDALGEWLYNNKYRVRSQDVAALVEKVYDSARQRQRETAESQRAAVVSRIHEFQVRKSETKADAAGPTAAEVEVARKPTRELPPTADAVATHDSSVTASEESGVRESPRAAGASPLFPHMSPVPTVDAEPSAATVSTSSAEGVPEVIEATPSSRYESIEAAISSLSPIGVDPSAREFDGQEVTGFPAFAAKRKQLQSSPPSATEILERLESSSLELTGAGPVEETPTEAGRLSDRSGISILYFLASTEATGQLCLTRGDVRKDVYFSSGRPQFVSSNVKSELFGQYLVNEGVVSSGELDMALGMMPQYGGMLGDTLVGLGLVRPLDIFRHLTLQVRQKLVDVCTWRDGEYSWYDGRSNDNQSFKLDLGIYETIALGALALTPAFLTSWMDAHRGDRPRFLENPRLTPEQFDQGEELREIYDRLNGTKTLGELLREYTDPRARGRFVRLLYLFTCTDLAEWDESL